MTLSVADVKRFTHPLPEISRRVVRMRHVGSNVLRALVVADTGTETDTMEGFETEDHRSIRHLGQCASSFAGLEVIGLIIYPSFSQPTSLRNEDGYKFGMTEDATVSM